MFFPSIQWKYAAIFFCEIFSGCPCIGLAPGKNVYFKKKLSSDFVLKN